MRHPRTQAVHRLLRTLLCVATALSLNTTPALGQNLEQAEDRAESLRTDVEILLRQLEDANTKRDAAEAEVNSLQARRDELTVAIARASTSLVQQVRTRFMLGGTPEFAVLLGSNSGNMAERASFLAVIEARQLGALQEAQGLRGSLASVEVILADRLAELNTLTADLDAQQAEISRRLASAERTVKELRSRKARQTELRNGAQNGTYACIFDKGVYHYVNSWGAPRSGGRAHQGTDVMAPRRALVYAFTNGRIERLRSGGGLGGIAIYLRGDDGHRYYYAHLDGFADGIHGGKRVEAGELIAFNGSTGNADFSAPHVHFEVHPGGGRAVNPYHWLTPLCT